MLKLPTLIALFICFVYSNNGHLIDTHLPSPESKILLEKNEEINGNHYIAILVFANNEHDVDTQLPLPKSQISLEKIEEKNGNVPIITDNALGEKQKRKPCKGSKNRRLGETDDESTDQFESLALKTAHEETNIPTIGNNSVNLSRHGGSYSKETVESKTGDNDLRPKNIENKKEIQFQSTDIGDDSNTAAIDSKSGESESIDVDGKSGETESIDIDVKSGEAKLNDIDGKSDETKLNDIEGRSDETEVNDIEGRSGETELNDIADKSGETELNDVDSKGAETEFNDIDSKSDETKLSDTEGKSGETELNDIARRSGEPELNDVVSIRGETELSDIDGKSDVTELSDIAGKSSETELNDIAGRSGETELNDVDSKRGETELDDINSKSGEIELIDIDGKSGDGDTKSPDIDGKSGESKSTDIDGKTGETKLIGIDGETFEIELNNSSNILLIKEIADKPNNDNVPLNIDIDERAINTTFSLNTRRSKCGKTVLSESSPNTLSDKRENLINQQFEEDNLLQDDPQVRRRTEVEVEKVVDNNLNTDEDLESSPTDDSIESRLIEPTRGKGIFNIKNAGVMLLEHSRVCYACSSVSDSSCWAPNKRTTVKYCKKGHQSCLTKSFTHKAKSVVIRDCGSFCVNANSEDSYYSSCSVCHSDLCNGSTTINIYTTGFTIIVAFGILFNKH